MRALLQQTLQYLVMTRWFMVFVVISVWAPQARAEVINDAARDFSSTNNPNGAWSYGASATLGSPFILYTRPFQTHDIDFWANDGSNYPHVSHNGKDSIVSGPTAVWDPGQLGLHPGIDLNYSMVQWTAPLSGLVRITGNFIGIDVVGPTTDVHVLYDNRSVFDGMVNGFGPGSGPSFDLTLEVTTGTEVAFTVGDGGNGISFDQTGLAAIITTVPEPNTLALLGIGTFGLLGYHGRQKSRAA